MNCKKFLFLWLYCFNSFALLAQTKTIEETSIKFNIIFIENENINKHFLSSVNLCNVDSFLITDLIKDSVYVKYEYPICTFKKGTFLNIRDSIFMSNKKYYILINMMPTKNHYIKIPYFSLLYDNTLLISRKKTTAKKGDCYYTLISKSSEYLPKTIVCKCEFIQIAKK